MSAAPRMEPAEYAAIAHGTEIVSHAFLLTELARTRCDLAHALAECAGLREAVAALARAERQRIALELAELR